MHKIADLIKYLTSPTITNFSLENVDFGSATAEEIQSLASKIATHTGLTDVNFSSVDLSKLDFHKLKEIFVAIQNNQNIQRFYFSFSKLENVSETNLDILFNCVKDKQDVTFCRNSIYQSDSAAEFIGRLAKSNIKKFDCELNEIGRNGYSVMKSIFKSLVESRFERLSLANNMIGYAHSCEKELVNLFSGNNKCIYLNGNRLGEGTMSEDWPEIFEALSKNEALGKLYLSHCTLGGLEDSEPEGFSEQLIKFVKTTKLQELSLASNGFSKEFTIKLLEAASENPNAHFNFDCSDNNLSQEEINKLKLTYCKQKYDSLKQLKTNGHSNDNGHSKSMIFTSESGSVNEESRGKVGAKPKPTA